MTIAETPTTLANISPTLIDPDPGNRTATVDTKFKASVAQHGVLEPVIVVHDVETGRYQLIAGERRWKAAKAADLPTIPAVIHKTLTETERVVLQVTENLHRADLTPVQQARQCLRLITLGMGVKELASAIGRSQGFIRDRLKIAELPAKARKRIDDGQWSIEDGLSVHELLEYPEALEALLANERYRNVQTLVSSFFVDLEREEAIDKMAAKAAKDGLTILTPNEEGKIAATDLRDIGIEDSDHADQECAAYVIKTGYKDARLVQVCSNRKNHNKAGKSALKATKRSANSLTHEQLAVRRQQREDKELRHEAITTAVMTKVSRTDADALIYRYAIDAATADQAKLACKFLGLEAAKDGTAYWPNVLKAEAVQNEAALARCALAVASAAADHNLDSNWNDGPLPATFKAWLKRTGWKPRRVAKPTTHGK